MFLYKLVERHTETLEGAESSALSSQFLMLKQKLLYFLMLTDQSAVLSPVLIRRRRSLCSQQGWYTQTLNESSLLTNQCMTADGCVRVCFQLRAQPAAQCRLYTN